MGADSVIILLGDDPAALADLVAPVRRRLSRAGWSRRVDHPFIQVFSPTEARLEITPAFDGHGVLVGEVFDGAGRPLSSEARRTLGCRRLDVGRARDVVRSVWGRYLLIRRTTGDVAVQRDPSGALDAVIWRRAGVTVVSTGTETLLDPLLPVDVAIDWAGVAALAARPGEFRHAPALHGVLPVAAGELRILGAGWTSREQVWTPAMVYREGRGRAAPPLRETVERAVRASAGDRRWVAEISGGLDSAIVAAALDEGQRNRVTAWVNHYVDQPEGDERAYARAVGDRLGFTLTEVRRDGLLIDEARLARSADGLRPAINDLDLTYNDDIAERIDVTGAWGSLTGQGGDAVFFQMPTPLIAIDEVWERGLGARPSVIHRTARWTRRSVWPHAWWSVWRDHQKSRATWEHPWLDDLRGVPPAKALQISALAFCQTFQGPAGRSRRGPCVNPLLSQPVMEAGLAWPAVDLTRGGRDRAAARAAFADVLPASLVARRSKGELGVFYGEAVSARLDFLRDYLLGGALADAGLISPELDGLLCRETLLWRGGFQKVLGLTLTEAWLRRWTERLRHRQV